MSLCLSAGGITVALALQAFTLAWTHSVERTEWREEWRVENDALRLESASVEGTGAGMEIPEGAVLKEGAWHFRPDLPPQTSLSLADAGRGRGDWRICEGSVCRAAGDLVPSRGRVLTLAACSREGRALADLGE